MEIVDLYTVWAILKHSIPPLVLFHLITLYNYRKRTAGIKDNRFKTIMIVIAPFTNLKTILKELFPNSNFIVLSLNNHSSHYFLLRWFVVSYYRFLIDVLIKAMRSLEIILAQTFLRWILLRVLLVNNVISRGKTRFVMRYLIEWNDSNQLWKMLLFLKVLFHCCL